MLRLYKGSEVFAENLKDIEYTVLPNILSDISITRSITDIGVSTQETKDFFVEINLKITSPMTKSDLVDVAIPYD